MHRRLRRLVQSAFRGSQGLSAIVSPLQIASGATISEVEVDEKLTARRAAQQGFNDCSFPTIAGVALRHMGTYPADDDACSV